MTEPTETDGSNETGGTDGSAAAEAARVVDSKPESGPERECPACGDVFEGGVAYRDHLFSVGLVY